VISDNLSRGGQLVVEIDRQYRILPTVPPLAMCHRASDIDAAVLDALPYISLLHKHRLRINLSSALYSRKRE